ncbi:MAG: flavin reductase family protein [Campylobacterales bacterium]|nr:flavin reductase family protein [Campylobacterales bacterium]
MNDFLSIDPKDESAVNTYNYLVGSVSPRPIALASTINKKGEINLAPFSFFNVVSSNPPMLLFSPVNRGADGSKKDTLLNIEEIKEVVINIVNHDIVQQVSLSSADYPNDVNEFVKAGFTMIESDLIKPLRVKESPVQYECIVKEIISIADNGGAGNLILCEVVKMHFAKNILNEKNRIDPYKIDLVARAGGNLYTRANEGYFELDKPFSKLGIGFDNLPKDILESEILRANDLGKLAGTSTLPCKDEILEFQKDKKELMLNTNKHLLAQEYLNQNEIHNAWMILL